MKNTVKIDQLTTAMSAICIINHKCQSFICNSCAAFVLSSTILYFLGERKTEKEKMRKKKPNKMIDTLMIIITDNIQLINKK